MPLGVSTEIESMKQGIQYCTVHALGKAAVTLALAVALTMSAMVAPSQAAAPKRKGVDPSAYVSVEPMTISIIEEFRVRGLMTLKIGLHIPDVEIRERVNTRMLQLQDAMVRTLTAYGVTSMRADAPPNLEVIDHRLKRAIDEVVGSQDTQILFDHVLVRQTD